MMFDQGLLDVINGDKDKLILVLSFDVVYF